VSDVTILIRSKNEEELLPRCLDMLFGQVTQFSFDVLLIDSGSTDQTVAIARRYAGVAVREIDPCSFNYGTTLNEGNRLARGRYVVSLSAHCVPADEHWLQRLVEPLEGDPTLGATLGRQIPWPWCDPVERVFLRNTFGDGDSLVNHHELDSDPLKVLFSNANSCFRRELALAFPFPELPWAEDRVWAHTILRAGYRLAYVSRSVVYHSHRRTIRGYFRTGYLDGRTQALLGRAAWSLRSRPWFGVRPLWRSLHRWHRICVSQGFPRSSTYWLAFSSLCRTIAFDVGVAMGQHKERPPSRSG
jgi:rhamnosyltransferase